MDKSLANDIQKIIAIENSGIQLRMSEFYGVDKICHEYLNINKYLPVKYVCYLEHGINFLYDYVNDRMLQSYSEIIFLDNSHRWKAIKDKLKSPSYPLGPLFVHYRRMHGIQREAIPEGILVYPSHSTHHVDSLLDWQKYAEQLSLLPDKFKPITVCLYWKDILANRHQFFLDQGFRVRTNGHIYDKTFVSRMYEILKPYKFVTGNGITSALLYALEMGIPAFIYGEKATYSAKEKKYLPVKGPKESKILKNVFDVLQLDPFSQNPVIGERQRNLLDLYVDEKNWIRPGFARKEVLKTIIPSLTGKGYQFVLKRLK